MASAIAVRPMRPDDLPAVRTVLQACGLASDKDVRVIAGGVLVAEWRERVVGMIQAIPAHPCAFIMYAAVLPEARCNGRTMHKLITQARRYLQSLGCPTVLAFVADDQPDWQRTLVKYGFTAAPRPGHLFTLKLS